MPQGVAGWRRVAVSWRRRATLGREAKGGKKAFAAMVTDHYVAKLFSEGYGS